MTSEGIRSGVNWTLANLSEVAWAKDRLSDRGVPVTGPVEQIKTWNLSALWRLPTDGGDRATLQHHVDSVRSD